MKDNLRGNFSWADLRMKILRCSMRVLGSRVIKLKKRTLLPIVNLVTFHFKETELLAAQRGALSWISYKQAHFAFLKQKSLLILYHTTSFTLIQLKHLNTFGKLRAKPKTEGFTEIWWYYVPNTNIQSNRLSAGVKVKQKRNCDNYRPRRDMPQKMFNFSSIKKSDSGKNWCFKPSPTFFFAKSYSLWYFSLKQHSLSNYLAFGFSKNLSSTTHERSRKKNQTL